MNKTVKINSLQDIFDVTFVDELDNNVLTFLQSQEYVLPGDFVIYEVSDPPLLQPTIYRRKIIHHFLPSGVGFRFLLGALVPKTLPKEVIHKQASMLLPKAFGILNHRLESGHWQE